MAADPRGDDSEAEMALEEADREVTPVGRVPEKLLELSGADDGNQNTRAYQAPAELLELARRQRQRAQAKTSAEAQPSLVPKIAEADAAPPRPIGESLPPRERPTNRPGRSDSKPAHSEKSVESSAPSIHVAPASSSDSMQHFLEDGEEQSDVPGDDAAPPVARSRPSRALSEQPAESAPRPPASLRELMRATSNPASRHSLLPANDAGVPSEVASSARTSTRSPTRVYYWVLIACAFILLGFALAKWRALDLLFPR